MTIKKAELEEQLFKLKDIIKKQTNDIKTLKEKVKNLEKSLKK